MRWSQEFKQRQVCLRVHNNVLLWQQKAKGTCRHASVQSTAENLCTCVCAICYIITLTHSSSCTKLTSFCRISSRTLRRKKQEEKNIHHLHQTHNRLLQLFPSVISYLPLMLKFFPSIRCLREGCRENAGMTASKSASKPAAQHTYTHIKDKSCFLFL